MRGVVCGRESWSDNLLNSTGQYFLAMYRAGRRVHSAKADNPTIPLVQWFIMLLMDKW